jgi:hypothetical protein
LPQKPALCPALWLFAFLFNHTFTRLSAKPQETAPPRSRIQETGTKPAPTKKPRVTYMGYTGLKKPGAEEGIRLG